MNYFRRIISASLSPNSEWEDVAFSLIALVSPWRWRYGPELDAVCDWFTKCFGVRSVYLFNSGRSALLGILSAFGVRSGDEVIVQAFTCVAVPNSVLWAGATPVFCDIDDSYNLNPSDVKAKITKKTKAIVVQHTFGIPADMDAIMTIAHNHNLIVIEDMAHALGATYKGKSLGTFGDAAFFSFGRDKAVSSVWGGAAIVRKSLGPQSVQLKKYHNALPHPSYGWILQQLLHPIAFAVILPLYNLGIGKAILLGLQKCRLLSFPVYRQEKLGGRPNDFPADYPNALAILLVLQLKKLERFIRTRRARATMYARFFKGRTAISSPISPNGSSFLRYPVLCTNPRTVIAAAKAQGMLLGNWYHNVVDPRGVDFSAIGYKKGSCPKAEHAACHIVNLPTLISSGQASRITKLLSAIPL